MAINKWMKAALKTLSYPDINIKKNYKFYRAVNTKGIAPVKSFYKMIDFEIDLDGYPIPVRVFTPKEERSDEVVIFFHGGGWVTGNIDSYTKACVHMAEALGRKVLAVDYRLAPEHPFPYALNDCYKATELIIKNCKEQGVDEKKVILMGDSAGGNLAACVSLMARDRGDFRIYRQMLLYPATYWDHSSSSPFASIEEFGYDYLLTAKRLCDYVDLYIQNEEDLHNPYFAPLLSDNLKDQPDTLIITAQYDPLRDEGEAYGEKLKEWDNQVEIYRMENALHGFFTLPKRFVHVVRAHQIMECFLKRGIVSEE